MNAPTADFLFKEADHMLEAAQSEIQRSEEDVVTHMICFNSRQSIANYLRGFLIARGHVPEVPFTIEGLHQKCIDLDVKFSQLDLSPVNCRHEEGHEAYCLAVEKVTECLDIARYTRQLATGC